MFNRAQKEVSKAAKNDKQYIPSSLPSGSPAIVAGGDGRKGYFAGSNSGGSSWMGSRTNSRDGMGEWKHR